MWKSFVKIVFRLRDIMAEAGGWLLAFMSVLIFVDVIARYFFNSPLPSVYEFSEEILMVGFIFLALSAAHHIDITLLVSKYHGRLKKNMAVARHLISFIFLGLATWQSAKMTLISLDQGEVSESILGYPLYPGRAVVIVGFGLLALIEFIRMVQTWTGGEVPE